VSKGKARIDAWDAGLTEAQRWEAYGVFCRRPWFEVAAFVGKEWGLPQPSRGALYRWAARMRAMESAHRVEQAVVAREEVGALAGAVALDQKLIDAYKSLAADFALKGGASEAVKYTRMAMDLAAGQTRRRELELKAAVQRTRDEQLRLAREKFEAAEARLTAVREAVAEAKGKGGLTEETLRKIEEAAKLL
jgi:hypothetical protein